MTYIYCPCQALDSYIYYITITHNIATQYFSECLEELLLIAMQQCQLYFRGEIDLRRLVSPDTAATIPQYINPTFQLRVASVQRALFSSKLVVMVK